MPSARPVASRVRASTAAVRSARDQPRPRRRRADAEAVGADRVVVVECHGVEA